MRRRDGYRRASIIVVVSIARDTVYGPLLGVHAPMLTVGFTIPASRLNSLYARCNE